MKSLREFSLSENEYATIEHIVANRVEWDVLKKLFRYEIDSFWNALRLTPPADTELVLSNHKLAAGVEVSLGDLVAQMEEVHKVRTAPKGDVVLPDQTQELLS